MPDAPANLAGTVHDREYLAIIERAIESIDQSRDQQEWAALMEEADHLRAKLANGEKK